MWDETCCSKGMQTQKCVLLVVLQVLVSGTFFAFGDRCGAFCVQLVWVVVLGQSIRPFHATSDMFFAVMIHHMV